MGEVLIDSENVAVIVMVSPDLYGPDGVYVMAAVGDVTSDAKTVKIIVDELVDSPSPLYAVMSSE
jgi:hypothetical protein